MGTEVKKIKRCDPTEEMPKAEGHSKGMQEAKS